MPNELMVQDSNFSALYVVAIFQGPTPMVCLSCICSPSAGDIGRIRQANATIVRILYSILLGHSWGTPNYPSMVIDASGRDAGAGKP